MFRFLTPHHRVASVLELTPERLRSMVLQNLLLDADGTLKRYRSDECAPGVAQWLDELRQAGFGLCLVSNGLGERIGRFALNAVAMAGPDGALTFATVAQEEGEHNAIYCRCPEPAR